jgi:ADP-heptose:LPS heptosyltransferase
LVISSDTGVAHIASAVKVPAVVLYGPTDPGRFWHGVDARGIVRSPLACCCTELHEVCLKPGHPSPGECMSAISVDMVETAVTQILNSFKKHFAKLNTQELIDESPKVSDSLCS